MPRFAGSVLTLGGTDYTVPPLNLRLYYEMKPKLNVVLHPRDHSQLEYTEAAYDLLLASIRRNYPSVRPDLLKEHATFADCPTYVTGLLTNAGFKRPDPLASPASKPAPEPAPEMKS